MRRVVIDTNLYIGWLNSGRHEAVLFQREAVKYLSAVVMLELYAGAFSPRDRKLVRGVVAAFIGVMLLMLCTRMLRPQASRTINSWMPLPLVSAQYLWHLLVLPVVVIVPLSIRGTEALGRCAKTIFVREKPAGAGASNPPQPSRRRESGALDLVGAGRDS